MARTTKNRIVRTVGLALSFFLYCAHAQEVTESGTSPARGDGHQEPRTANSGSSQATGDEQRVPRTLFDHTGKEAGNTDISMRIVGSILPGDPGYFPKVNSWGEYLFERKTFSAPVRITSAFIVSDEGVPVSIARSSRDLLEAPKFAKEYATNTVLMTGATVAGMTLGAFIPFLGPALFAGIGASQHMRADAKVEYDKEFGKKVRRDVRHLESDARIVSSAFFPLVPNARSIVVEYSTGAGFSRSGRLEIPLK